MIILMSHSDLEGCLDKKFFSFWNWNILTHLLLKTRISIGEIPYPIHVTRLSHPLNLEYHQLSLFSVYLFTPKYYVELLMPQCLVRPTFWMTLKNISDVTKIPQQCEAHYWCCLVSWCLNINRYWLQLLFQGLTKIKLTLEMIFFTNSCIWKICWQTYFSDWNKNKKSFLFMRKPT